MPRRRRKNGCREESQVFAMKPLIAILLCLVLVSCGGDVTEMSVGTAPPAPPLRMTRNAETVESPTLEAFYASGVCEEARERVAGSDLVVGPKEQGQPSWEERFLDVDVVVRAKLHSMYPQIVPIDAGESGVRYYPAIGMDFRVFEVFKGSVSLDYIVVWQMGWDYYGDYRDAECVRLEDIADLRKNYAYFDDREAILFLKRTRSVEIFENITSFRENYLISRLPSGVEPLDLLEDEKWRWLPHYKEDSFYNKKYLVDILESETKGTVTRQELREVGRNIERLRHTHDLECVYEAYRRVRNYDENLGELMKSCVREQ